MKKTYFAPTLEDIKLTTVQMLANSPTGINKGEDNSVGEDDVLSRGFGGGLWEEED